MASSSPSPSEEVKLEPPRPSSPTPTTVRECVYKTKLVEFLGRTTPIVLQNDNGPCPLLAICNVLLLKNNFNLSPETTEVSQERLLSLVAERLLDTNINIDNKEASYVANQQQNISDAIDLLPRLATGIDVNIKFRRIKDFEFTPECAIFDLLDIPLYHGWIIDPQDTETAIAIGSKSYNALVEELVALETQNECKYENTYEEDGVDFAAATTATLGVPSPCLSKARSFGDSPRFDSDHQNARKGDQEEEAELLRALEISQAEFPPSLGDSVVADVNDGSVSVSSDESIMKIMPVDSIDTLEKHTSENKFQRPDLSISDDHGNERYGLVYSEGIPQREVNLLEKDNEGKNLDPPPASVESERETSEVDMGEKSNVDALGQIESSVSFYPGKKDSADEQQGNILGGSDKCDNLHYCTVAVHETTEKKNVSDSMDLPNAELNSDSSSGRMTSDALVSTESEPLYEGEDCIMDPRSQDTDVREPVYEGEVILANQADKSKIDLRSKDDISLQPGELIKNFLRNNASQLTIYGLFCLQDGLKERELCVFFRNNHFSTMFKINNELYLLATDQGFLNQHDLVWEKLNEVNGNTLFVTGNFQEFKMENHSNDNWNEEKAVSGTAEFMAAQAEMDMNSDMHLAMTLQQEEFDQQSKRQNSQQQQQPQPSLTSSSRLITGPHVPRSSGRNPPSAAFKPESKPKEKCTVM